MATAIDGPAASAKPLRADRYEKILLDGAIVLGIAILTALIRGRARWAEVPMLVWLPLATIAVALALTPTMLLSAWGTGRHWLLGRICDRLLGHWLFG
ncbi:MAG TPA: hypothetical protein VFQ57_04865 [Sphingomonas sp.]|jgi:uncharacterized protein (DUF983 family)|nr:hypothetical protein [Sphingomonas sp.]